MTISEAIALADSVEENRFPTATKVEWLSLLDGRIYNEVILAHEDSDEITYEPYTAEDAETTDLLVPDPYSDFYPWYLQSRIQLSNGDTARYNQSIIMYNVAFQAWQDAYNREHMPVQKFRLFRT